MRKSQVPFGYSTSTSYCQGQANENDTDDGKHNKKTIDNKITTRSETETLRRKYAIHRQEHAEQDEPAERWRLPKEEEWRCGSGDAAQRRRRHIQRIQPGGDDVLQAAVVPVAVFADVADGLPAFVKQPHACICATDIGDQAS